MPNEQAKARRTILRERVKLLRLLTQMEQNRNCYISAAAHQLRDWDLLHKDSCLSLASAGDGAVSYARTPADKYSIKRRVRMSFPRFLRRVVGISDYVLQEHQLNEAHHFLIECLVDGDKYMRIVNGPDINLTYNHPEFPHSCMKKTPYTRFYGLNPDKVQMLVYDNHIKARALLWTCDDGTKCIDRIYPDDCGPQIPIMLAWAQKHNYLPIWHKARVLEQKLDRLEVTCKHDDFFPYIDSFRYGVWNSDGTVRLQTDPAHADIQFDGTDGLARRSDCRESPEDCPDDDPYTCDNCGGNLSENWYDCNGEILCRRCYERDWYVCGFCGLPRHIRTHPPTQMEHHQGFPLIACPACAAVSHHCTDCGEPLTGDVPHPVFGERCEICHLDFEYEERRRAERWRAALPTPIPACFDEEPEPDNDRFFVPFARPILADLDAHMAEMDQPASTAAPAQPTSAAQFADQLQQQLMRMLAPIHTNPEHQRIIISPQAEAELRQAQINRQHADALLRGYDTLQGTTHDEEEEGPF